VLESAFGTGPACQQQPCADDYGYGDPGYSDPSYDGPGAPPAGRDYPGRTGRPAGPGRPRAFGGLAYLRREAAIPGDQVREIRQPDRPGRPGGTPSPRSGGPAYPEQWYGYPRLDDRVLGEQAAGPLPAGPLPAGAFPAGALAAAALAACSCRTPRLS
jgi:hypothetical protein